MLLVLKPLTFVFLTIGKGIRTHALSLALHVLAFIGIPVFPHRVSFSMWFPRYHFTLVLTSVFRQTRTE